MKITVVIPCYNEVAHLPACLESLKAQTRPADDIIVVDNNSTDDSAAIAKAHGATVIKEPRQGMTYARNAGFDAVKEGIIARTDADAVLPEDWLQRIEANWQRHPDSVAVSGPRIHDDIPWWRGGKTTFWWLINEALMQLLFGHPTLNGPNLALTHEAWHKIAGEVCLDDKTVHEDLDLSVHLHRYGRIVYDRKLVVHESGRRVIDLWSWYFIYPLRTFQTRFHKHSDTKS